MVFVTLTALTLVAFAANSLLCRMALGGDLIDPGSFMAIRLVSGAVALIPISRWLGEKKTQRPTKGSWMSGFLLFAYAAAFSWAYVSLNTGTGALVLFGSVQLTMIAAALLSGESLESAQWIGLAAAIGGLVYLVLPGISSPDPLGALLMCVSGIAWGFYSIRGKGTLAPIAMTAGNFLRSTPMAIVTFALAFSGTHWKPQGILLALISGVLTSGLGYVLWYKVLPSLTMTQAAVLQLLVPVLAAFAGVAFLSEQLSARLITASVMILGGVAWAVIRRKA